MSKLPCLLNHSWSRSQLLFLLWLVIEDHDNLFVMAEVVHFLGIGVLLYKLTTKRNAGGAFVLSSAYLAGLEVIMSAVLCFVPYSWRSIYFSLLCVLRRSVTTVARAHSVVPRSAALLQVLVDKLGSSLESWQSCVAASVQQVAGSLARAEVIRMLHGAAS